MVCVLKLERELLLATNLGGGKLLLLGSSEMEKIFLNSKNITLPFIDHDKELETRTGWSTCFTFNLLKYNLDNVECAWC